MLTWTIFMIFLDAFMIYFNDKLRREDLELGRKGWAFGWGVFTVLWAFLLAEDIAGLIKLITNL